MQMKTEVACYLVWKLDLRKLNPWIAAHKFNKEARVWKRAKITLSSKNSQIFFQFCYFCYKIKQWTIVSAWEALCHFFSFYILFKGNKNPTHESFCVILFIICKNAGILTLKSSAICNLLKKL